MTVGKFKKISRHLIDGQEVSPVIFWASWNGWAHHQTYDQRQIVNERLDKGEAVDVGLQTFKLEYEQEG